MAVVPTVAAAKALAVWTGQVSAAVPWVLRLYENDVTPDAATTGASFTEVSGGGYAPIVLDKFGWGIGPGAPTYAQQPEKIFAFSGGTGGWGTVYGFYLVDADGEVVLAQRFVDPPPPFYPTSGTLIKVTPRLSLGSLSGD